MVEIVRVNLLHDEAYQKLSLDKLIREAKLFRGTPMYNFIAYISDTSYDRYAHELINVNSTAFISDVCIGLTHSIKVLYKIYESIISYKEFVNGTVKKELIKNYNFFEMESVISDITECSLMLLDEKDDRSKKILKAMDEGISLINKFKETFTELEPAERFLMVSGVLR